ncbi:MAG: HDOD domain-containing protein, partial [Rhodoferax sp.]|nr:HDOD domain-containing protein [Rhodoferax sp.]
MSPPHTPQAEATLARLAPHLQRRPDLPALSGATREVQRVSRRETAHVRALVEAAERDPGLSARLLRLANTAACASAGAGANDSIDRAIRLLGFDTVRSLAAGLPMLDLGAGPDSPVLAREWLLRSLLAAQIARELCDHGRLADAAHLAALFQNLGRLLLAVHLPQDAATVRRATPATAWPRAPHEDRAARRHLGWQLPALGAQVARQWGWPASVRASMTRPLAPSPRPAHERDEQLRRVAQTANDLADLLIDADPRHWRQACDDCVAAGDTGAGRDADVLLGALARTRPQLEALAELVALPRSERAQWQRGDITRAAPGSAADTPVDADEGAVLSPQVAAAETTSAAHECTPTAP